MKILSLEKTKNGFFGYGQVENKFINFNLKNKKLKTHEYSNMRNYEHFRNVIWKFNSHVWFTDKPVEISKLTKTNLENVFNIFKRRDWNGGNSPWK